MKFLTGWKTMAFNAVMVVVFALNQFGAFGAETAPTGEQVQAGLDSVDQGVALLTAIGNMILRAMTKTTVFKKTSPAPSP